MHCAYTLLQIEDAAVLGTLLSHLSSPAQLGQLLQAYQDLRLERTSNTQASSRMNQKIFHLPDGPEQEERDRMMREAWVDAPHKVASAAAEQSHFPVNDVEMQKPRDVSVNIGIPTPPDSPPREVAAPLPNANAGNPNQWADQRKNREQFGYDADLAAEQWWRNVGVKACVDATV